MKKFLISVWSSKGASLVEVLIAAGMMGGLALMMANISENSIKATMSAEMRFDAMYALDKIYRDLSTMNTCSTTFEGLTLKALKDHDFTAGPMSVSDVAVYKTRPITDTSACDSKDDSTIAFYRPSLTDQQNCKLILERPFARKQAYHEQCEKKVSGTIPCKLQADSFFSTMIPADNKALLYKKDDIVLNTKFENLEIVSFEEDPSGKFVNLEVRATVDIRGRKSNVNVIGSNTKSKLFNFKAFVTNTGPVPNKEKILSCQGELSEESAVEKACDSLGGEYSAGNCHVPGRVRNCRQIVLQIAKTGFASGFQFDDEGNHSSLTINDPKIKVLDILSLPSEDVLMNTFPYKVTANGIATPALDIETHGQNLKFFTASAGICNEGEIVLNAYGYCALTIDLVNKKDADGKISQSLIAQISRPGDVDKEKKLNYWTLGCGVPEDVLDNHIGFNVQMSGLCCENY